MRIARLIRSATLGLVVLGSAFSPRIAEAEWKPTREVEFVIPYGLGGGADLLARTIAKIITEQQLVPTSIVPVNKPGGGSAVGVGYVVSAKNADPHTLVLINPQTQITPLRVEGSSGWRSLTPIANFMLDDYLLFVRKDSPHADARALVDAAKSQGERSISVGSAGTADDLAIAVFEAATGTRLNVVRFNSGGEILTALLGGHVDVAAGNPLEYMGQLEAGAIRALGVFRPTRFEAMPDVPTLTELGIETAPFQMWRGVALPAGVPADAQEYWTNVMQQVANSAELKAYIEANVATYHPLFGADFVAFLEKQEALYKDMLARLEQK